ncbi:hypothetical protein F5Y08DRAFT_324719 [Xylaria arbuscula]|nr:hypothetical protein F5Y08DRAFT_324719 [Xylaria arbuscula]
MAHILDTSIELQQHITRAPQPIFNEESMTRIELKRPDGTLLDIELYRLQYHKEWDDIVNLAKNEASKIREVTLASKYNINAFLLRSGAVFPGKEIALMIPIGEINIDNAPRVAFHRENERARLQKWERKLYILEPGVCVRIARGNISFLWVSFQETESTGEISLTSSLSAS